MNRSRLTNLGNGRHARTEFRIENAASDEADIYLYSPIGGWFGITADEFVRDLREVDASRINLHINSPGGEVFDGIAIHNALVNHAASVTVFVDGLAASAASFIAMAGDRVVMAKHATMMIHDPWGFTVGDARDHRKQADLLDRLGDTIADIYLDRAGGTRQHWRDLMLEETWYSDREAVEAGLADEVAGDAEAEDRFDLSVFDFRNTPDHLKSQRSGTEREPTKREAERALREAGLSAAAAKAVLAGGWDANDDGARDESLTELAAFINGLTEGARA
ncbi:MAG: Clp protease ClpP [Dehalococcoidia bacterium]|nr:Clp protease ClpP [Dehalococcoidia bacterium]